MLQDNKRLYKKIIKLLKDNKDDLVFDIDRLETQSKLHLLGLELKETYGLDINPKEINSFDWIDCGEYVKIAWFGDKYNRTISWSDNDTQPKDEMLVILKFSTGAYIFGDGDFMSKDYPTNFFHKFFMELMSFKPDYSDSHNHCLYWKLENTKEIFNSFNGILKKYYDLNREDIKQRRIEKMKKDLETLQAG